MKKALNRAEETANKQQTNIKIKEPQRHFIIVYESIYKNNDLNADEIALLIKLIAIAPTFKPSQRKLEEILKINHRRFIKTTKSLQQKGYLEIKNNAFKGSEWIVHQEPQINEDFNNEEEIIYKMVNGIIKVKDLINAVKNYKLNYQKGKNIYNAYIKELQRIGNIPWINDGEGGYIKRK